MNDFMQYDFTIQKILLACYVGKGKGMIVHKNRSSHGLAFHTSGVKLYEFENGSHIIVNPNEIIYLPKHSSYEVSALVPGDCFAINFDISEEKAFEPFCVGIKNPASFSEHFKTAENIWHKKSPGYNLKSKAELYQILYMMAREYDSEYVSNEKYAIIKPAVEYIHREYTSGLISIEKLSDMCGKTPEYFRKIFKAYYGISPLKYINTLKIAHAKELIASGMYSVTEAALQSGYTDLSYFSREFKKATGICPRNYD